MFTDGLDETAINWVKQGSDIAQLQRSPIVEKYPLADPVSNIPFCYRSNGFLSPKVLPPPKFASGLLGPHLTSALADSGDENESVASVSGDFHANYSDNFDEEGFGCFSDSDHFEKPDNVGCNQDITSRAKLAHELLRGHALVRSPSKTNLIVDVAARFASTHAELGTRRATHKNPISESLSCSSKELGTPSAPPIIEIGGESKLNLDAKQWVEPSGELREGFSSESKHTETVIFSSSQVTAPRSISKEGNVQTPKCQVNIVEKIPSYTPSFYDTWHTFVAYDACFRLCLNAWSRNCEEAPEFLRDECMVLRSAFGLQNYLLQPQGRIQDNRQVDDTEEIHKQKGRKIIGQIEVEVRRIRIIPERKKLHATSSQRMIYAKMGAEYVRHVSTVLKSRINSLKSSSFPIAPEEALSCLLRLKSMEDTPDTCSIYVNPGSGDSHIFYPESLGDDLLVEIQDINNVSQGRATIQISSLVDSHGEVLRWWPIYLDGHGYVGKIQLLIGISGTSGKIGSAKSGPVVETLIYDIVMEAAMHAQNFHPKNLHISGIWKWLLNEFADYYGVSDAYTKLRYLSYIMNISTPTKDCLELIYELLLPVLKARSEKSLTRQERSILLDCEDQIKNLLAITFENYKSLDELSHTGLMDMFGPIFESAAPALVPAVQIFTLLHDILSQEAQNLLRNYLQTAAGKRCRQHMFETDEFMSSNSDGFLTDHMTISTAYLKVKALCLNITNEIQADIKVHNQHILPCSIDLPNIAASVYSTELCKRLKGFLSACPPSKPSQHVTELLITTADFERHLDSWNINRVHGGVVSRELFHDYILVWIQDTRIQLLELCRAEKGQPGISTHCSTSPFVEKIYGQICCNLNTYEVVIKRWPQYLLSLESAVSDVERAIMKALEKQYSDVLMPLRDGIPKMLEKKVQKLTRRQSTSAYLVPNQLGTFLSTVKRILEVLHCKVEDILKSWAAYLISVDGSPVFGEQMNGITVMLRKKYKSYMQAIVEELINNVRSNRSTKLKRILEDTKESDGETDIRERMQALCLQLTDSIRNLHNVFPSRIFVAICRGFWDKMGQIVLSFLESRKENRVWYRGSDYALVILDDIFASEMQTLQGNSLQDADLDPPRSVIEARSILC